MISSLSNYKLLAACLPCLGKHDNKSIGIKCLGGTPNMMYVHAEECSNEYTKYMYLHTDHYAIHLMHMLISANIM